MILVPAHSEAETPSSNGRKYNNEFVPGVFDGVEVATGDTDCAWEKVALSEADRVKDKDDPDETDDEAEADDEAVTELVPLIEVAIGVPEKILLSESQTAINSFEDKA